MINTEIDLNADLLDVRDIIARVEELRDERDASEIDAKDYGGPADDWKDEREELAQLEGILAELSGCGGDEQWEGDWYPVTLINESYFTDYAMDMLSDIGELPRDIPHYIVIDRDATAENIKVDYTAIEIGDTTFYYH